MIEQNVQVVQCLDEHVRVRVGSQSGCSACDAGKGCSAGLFAKLVRRKPLCLDLARNGMDVEEGQMLTLAIPENVFIKVVFVSYGWPLLAALAGAIVGHGLCAWFQFSSSLIDAGTLLSGILAGGLAVIYANKQENRKEILNSLGTVVYYPANKPNMCTRNSSKETQ